MFTTFLKLSEPCISCAQLRVVNNAQFNIRWVNILAHIATSNITAEKLRLHRDYITLISTNYVSCNQGLSTPLFVPVCWLRVVNPSYLLMIYLTKNTLHSPFLDTTCARNWGGGSEGGVKISPVFSTLKSHVNIFFQSDKVEDTLQWRINYYNIKRFMHFLQDVYKLKTRYQQ